MTTSVALWSVELQPGKPRMIMTPDLDLQITNVALGEELADANGRTVLKLIYSPATFDDEEDGDDDEEDENDEEKQLTTVICALTPGKIEHASINIILNRESTYTLQSSGKNTIYLSGQYIDQALPDEPPFDDDSDMDSEDAYDLQDVSSDVEMHPDDLEGLESDASRFEEVVDEPTAKPQKRPRDSDAAPDAKVEGEKEGKKNKKLKGEKGAAVPVEGQTEDKKDKKKKEKKAGDEQKAEKAGPSKKTLPSGVVIQDAKVGTGPAAKKGSTVRMRYVGKFPDGKVFDKNTSGKPFTFHLGKGEVIKGWDEGIVGMQVGGERALVIPPAMAYGKRPPPGIPPNATLHFEVKLLEIK
ncbi:hypothetical protein CVT24_000054 [Panaeolus cyanescens]|uniref:peptidylprolyl isomerase n=1 Tax=Panaeolus cyanescens TaxID=181874 RepID=A0A409VWC9_9AGAR|nr:hypothetical protein CVT24_000054 [Panaeolus cyanescens]